MSVINKMLRDLDSRQTTGSTPADAQALRAGLAQGTRVVHDSERAKSSPGRSRRIGLMAAIVVVALGAMAGTGWYLYQVGLPLVRVEQSAQAPAFAVSPPAVAVVPVAPVAAPALAQKASEPVSSARAAEASVSEQPPKVAILATPVAPPVAVKGPAAQLRTAPAYPSLKMDSNFQGRSVNDTATAPPAAGTPRAAPVRSAPAASTILAPAAPAVTSSLPRQSPAQEALAQAQSLSRAGSNEAAIALLHDALLVAERANLAGAPTGSTAVLASLARELARIELAEGRVSQALEMLTRLEPALAEVADIWAIRGNAAQRLGRHRESVAAYLMALKLRPNEPRWMLGAAVSLAAQGHIEGAAEQAEKARAGGALSPEVATYLRQLGVPLRER